MRTITHGTDIHDFHLFEEMEETDKIYLKLDSNEFTATSFGIEVAIPLDVWEHLRKHTHSILASRYANKTDTQIEQIIRNEVMTPEYCQYFKNTFGEEPSFEQLFEDAQAERDKVEQIRIKTSMLDKDTK